jgi:uncharacterized UBP type Zn finger protein
MRCHVLCRRSQQTPIIEPMIGGMKLLLNRLTRPPATCDHVPAAMSEPQADACQECGSHFNLRQCADCGHIGCCESQAGHARKHALTEGHPVIYQVPAGGGFTWCYEDRRYV